MDSTQKDSRVVRPRRCMYCGKTYPNQLFKGHVTKCLENLQKSSKKSNDNDAGAKQKEVPIKIQKKSQSEMKKEKSNCFRITKTNTLKVNMANVINNSKKKQEKSNIQMKAAIYNKRKEEQASKLEIKCEQKSQSKMANYQQTVNPQESTTLEDKQQIVTKVVEQPAIQTTPTANAPILSDLPDMSIATTSTNLMQPQVVVQNSGFQTNQTNRISQNSLLQPDHLQGIHEPFRLSLNPQAPALGPLQNIERLTANSESIISFLQRINSQQDQTIHIMIHQLQQLNNIARQLTQISRLGRLISINMNNVFIERIQQLYIVIIHQIALQLGRRFQSFLGAQFQLLAQQQPQIKAGFTQSQIQQLFEPKINISIRQCSICLQDMNVGSQILELQCRHAFHPNCIKEWLNTSRKCPLCRCEQKHTH